LLRVQYFHIVAFINTLGLLLTGKHIQIHHVLKDKRLHSTVVHVW